MKVYFRSSDVHEKGLPSAPLPSIVATAPPAEPGAPLTLSTASLQAHDIDGAQAVEDSDSEEDAYDTSLFAE